MTNQEQKNKSEILESVLREFQTSMTALRGGISKMLDGNLGETTEDQRGQLNLSMDALERLERITDDLYKDVWSSTEVSQTGRGEAPDSDQNHEKFISRRIEEAEKEGNPLSLFAIRFELMEERGEEVQEKEAEETIERAA